MGKIARPSGPTAFQAPNGGGISGSVRLSDARPDGSRARFWFRNFDAAATFYLSTQDEGGKPVGIPVPPKEWFIDDPPCSHDGEWWVSSDTVNGLYIFFFTNI
jgi:hypothetical protein